jgi:hypothetical protein
MMASCVATLFTRSRCPDFFGGRGEKELCEVNWSARQVPNRDGLMFPEAAENIQPHHLMLLNIYPSEPCIKDQAI